MNNFPSSANFDFWIKNNLNVLFIGKRGIGKTESVIEKFNEHYGDKWMYLSASTMDPWVDLIGVPKEVKDDNGKSYLELIRPKKIEDNEVEAIMVDEYNRAPAKVRNAIMELIQFKSINGKKFNNLKIVWAAINPYTDDHEYDVEKLDPAQEDRFHVHVNMPYDVSDQFFIKKYGVLGKTACNWWRRLSDEQKDKLSPRRLEYALNMYNLGGELSYVLPYEINSSELARELDGGSSSERLNALFLNKNDEETRQTFSNENFVHAIENDLLKSEPYMKYFVPFLSKDKLVSIFFENPTFRSFMTINFNYNDYQTIFDPILKNKTVDIKHSIIAAIERWKKRYISDAELSDADYISVVTDFRHNMSYIKDKNKQSEVIDRFLLIADNATLKVTDYQSMIGISMEILHENINNIDDQNRDKIKINKILNVIKQMLFLLNNTFHVNNNDIISDQMLGLRYLKTDKASYKNVIDLLESVKIL